MDMTIPLTSDLFEGANAVTVSAKLELVNSDSQNRVLLYPPTYMDGTYKSKHVISKPDENGISSHVLIDSVQSQARRISKYYPEIDRLPDIYTTINGDQYSATSDLAHRAYDAILRDSLLGDTPWIQSEVGQQLANASLKNATALYRHSPATLIFGGWDSHTGKSDPFRIARCLSSEIWASNGEVMTRVATKGSPVVIKNDEQVFLDDNHLLQTGEAPKKSDQKRPSEIGHGTVPSQGEAKGVIVDADSIRLTGALSLTRLNRYRFPVSGTHNPEIDRAGRNVIACIALYLLAQHIETGLDLRSGCDLEAVEWSWTLRQGLNGKQAVEVNSGIMQEQLDGLIEKAENLGLTFADSTYLEATPALESIISRY